MALRLIKKILFLSFSCSVFSISFADMGLSSINTSISNNADKKMTGAINVTIPFVVSNWAMLAAYYNQNSAFPAAGIYAVDTSILNGVKSITNSNYGTLEIRFSADAPGPMANNGFALAPTRVSRQGNIFYVYELAKCFTNTLDSVTTLNNPQPGTPSNIFNNSNLGILCVYAQDPYTAAINEVQGGTIDPSNQNGASS